MSDLKMKTAKGLSWSLLEVFFNKGINFLVGIILARILSPSEFGLIGVLTIFISILSTLIESGFTTALIRKISARSIDYNTVFYFNIVSSIFLYGTLYLLAPLISQFFDDNNIILLLRTLGFVLIFSSFGIIQKTILTKQLNFKIQAKISIVSSIISGMLGVFLAINNYGVWSLVIREISRQFLISVFFWIFSNWRPAVEFSTKSLFSLFGFGSKILFANLLESAYRNIYYTIIGKFFTISELGQYTRAEQFNSLFSNTLTSVIQRVSFPVFSQLQNNDDKLKLYFKQAIQTAAIVTFPLMLGLIAVAEPLLLVLIGDKWHQAIIYLQIIAVGGAIYPMHALNIDILLSKGRSDLFIKLEFFKKSLLIIPILLGAFISIKFMLIGSVFVSYFGFYLNSFYSKMLINYSAFYQFRDISPIFLISVFVSFLIWCLTLFNFSSLTTLLLQIGSGITIYLIIFKLSNSPIIHSFKNILHYLSNNNYD